MKIDRIEDIEPYLEKKISGAFKAVGAAEGVKNLVLQRPPKPEMGDYAIACFPLAKLLRKAPPKIAAELATQIELDELLCEAKAEGGFVNLRLDPGVMARVALGQALEEAGPDESGLPQLGFGRDQVEKKHKYLIEFSSPNTNKPLHLGHVRNNTIGLSVCRLLAHLGHKVTSVSLVNDRGVHICKTMLVYRKWGDAETPESLQKKGDHYVGELYVEFDRKFDEEYSLWLDSDEGRARYAKWHEGWQVAVAQQAERKKSKRDVDPKKKFRKDFEDEYFNTISDVGGQVRELLRRWEGGDEEVRELWSRMNGWVYEGFATTYERMGVSFDRIDHESQTYELGRKVVEEGLDHGLFRRLDDGAVICDYEKLGISAGQTPYKVLLRGDGTTVYTTQDLGTALMRYAEVGFEKMVYIVGDEQQHHFKVLFELLGLVQPELADACHHLAYGMVNLPEGKMKSREGKVVDADDLMDEMASLASEELRSRSETGRAHSVDSHDGFEIAHRAEVIGLGALKFFLLSFNAASTMTFDPKKSIDFLGRTGPYCLNSYARTRSILAKAGGRPELDRRCLELLTSEREQAVVRAVANMPAELSRAGQNLDPSKVVDAAYEVARAFNQLYTDKEGHPIVTCDDSRLRRARLMLTLAVGGALRTGLYLLGIDTLEEM